MKLLVILGLLIGVMVWSAMAQEDVALASEDNTELLERIALLENNAQAQAQEISNLRNKSNDTTKLLSVVERAIVASKQPDWGLMLSVCAAIVATGVAVWNVYIGLRDRGHLKIVSVGEMENSRLNAVCFVITNEGRRPLTLLYWSVKTTGNYFTINDITLKESEAHEVKAVEDGLKLPKGVKHLREMKDFLVRDSHGDEWNLSRKERKQFVKRSKKAMSDDG